MISHASDVLSPSHLRYVQSIVTHCCDTHIVLVHLSIGIYNIDVLSPSRLSSPFNRL